MTDHLIGIVGFYRLPLWLNAVLILALFLAAIELGRWTAMRVSKVNEKAVEAARGDVTLGALLALLGLLLAFTYAFGLSRYDQRKEAIIAEINALGTAFLRADFLSEPGRTNLQRKLLDYARTRLVTAEMVRTPERLVQTLRASTEAQELIWPATVEALVDDVPGPIKVSVISAINNVLDVHTQRVTAGFDFIPPVIMILLVLVSAFALASTAHNSALQGNTSRWRRVAFAVILAALILVIMDFDMPQHGLIRPNIIGLKELISDMEAVLAR